MLMVMHLRMGAYAAALRACCLNALSVTSRALPAKVCHGWPCHQQGLLPPQTSLHRCGCLH